MSTFPEPQISADPERGARVARDDRAHVFHSWSAQALINPMPIAGASGSHFWDFEGKRYLDFSSQLVNVNIGYQHPKLVAAIQEAAARQCTIAPSFADESRSEAARLIAGLAPGTLNRVFFTNGGAEATENAMRMARLHTGRHKVLTTYRSYHGATAGAITATGDPRRWASEPGMSGIVHFWGPYPYRSAFHATTEEQECERALQHLRDTIMVEGASTIAAVMLETVVGTNGILVPPRRLPGRRARDLRRARHRVDRRRGHGRLRPVRRVVRRRPLGRRPRPDLLRQGRQLRLRAARRRGHLRRHRRHLRRARLPRWPHLLGAPAGLRVGRRVDPIFEEEGILENVRKVSDTVIAPRLAEIAQKHPSVGEVRGLGFFWALELVRDRETREPLVPYNAGGAAAGPMNEFAAACKAEGLWPFMHFNRTHVVPPCTTTADEMAEGLDMLDRALEVADRFTA